jgi:uncharacterized protein (UPF0332 family)
MSLSDLLRNREIQKVDADSTVAKKLVGIAEKAVAAANDNCKMGHNDVALQLAYNAMLNSGRALMANMGYRAYTETHHKSVVSFCTAVLPENASQLVALFNRYRVRRHDIVYGEIEGDSVGADEAKTAIEKASELLELIKKKL